tara:strand:- start:1843 stop:2364 length:522 start_codon:yes stop_codon:yes gene_type:complete
MNKIIKITFLLFFVLTTINAYAINEPPFRNILVNKQPIEYENIVFNDYDGNSINLKDYESKIYMLNFWATWCLPCKVEMPYLDKLQNTKGVKVFPINVGRDSKKKTQIFFKELEIKNLLIYFDIETNLVNLFQLRGLPTTIILNEDRKEIARIVGVVDFSDQKFIDWMNTILK